MLGIIQRSICCTTDNIQKLRVCIESVKFPGGKDKSTYTDVIMQVHKNGLMFKSSSNDSVITTTCKIKGKFFNSFTIEDNSGELSQEESQVNAPLMELCLPISELK